MHHLPNFLILVGTNRNAGKTTLACNIISKFSINNKVVGLKISPHFHELDESEEIISRSGQFVIVEETRTDTEKDSSRMLNAGASKVFYLQVWDENLAPALDALFKLLDPDALVVCESGWVRNIVKPGLFLILNRMGDDDRKATINKYKNLADAWIDFDGENFDFDVDLLSIQDGKWNLKV